MTPLLIMEQRSLTCLARQLPSPLLHESREVVALLCECGLLLESLNLLEVLVLSSLSPQLVRDLLLLHF